MNREQFKFEVVYGSHMQNVPVVIKHFENEDEADQYVLELIARLPWHEQVNYWVRPTECA